MRTLEKIHQRTLFVQPWLNFFDKDKRRLEFEKLQSPGIFLSNVAGNKLGINGKYNSKNNTLKQK